MSGICFKEIDHGGMGEDQANKIGLINKLLKLNDICVEVFPISLDVKRFFSK